MAYSELIKKIEKIRMYLRSFYVYGFRHRDDFTQKSARSYDDERRRVDSWLGEYMSFGQDKNGRRVFLSVNSRDITENPLYNAFRAKSFTDTDITLHFHIMDILRCSEAMNLNDILNELSARLAEFDSPDMPDESTVRRKLKEYEEIGLVMSEKAGREKLYSLSRDETDLCSWDAAAAFFSESAVLGVLGSFIMDRIPDRFRKFRFKHHYILNALDSEIISRILPAITEKRLITFGSGKSRQTALPLRIYVGTQTGRQYVLLCNPGNQKFSFRRTDLIDSVKVGDRVDCPEGMDEKVREFCSHIWGVNINNASMLDHIEMTIYAGEDEQFIVQRLRREKRCGTVTQIDDTHWLFSADVYYAAEMLPWIRTFTGRITDLRCSDHHVEERFRKDFLELDRMYGGDGDAV